MSYMSADLLTFARQPTGSYTASGPGGTWTIRRDGKDWVVDIPAEKEAYRLGRLSSCKTAAQRLARKAAFGRPESAAERPAPPAEGYPGQTFADAVCNALNANQRL